MKFFSSIVIYGTCIFLFSCANNNTNINKEEPPGSDTLVFRKGIDIIPDVKFTDSVQVLFYKNPDGDPERYTRFYTHVTLTDSGFTKSLLDGLDQSFREYAQVKNCRSEGKMYLFKQGGGDPLQTIYFSTRCDTCCYVYYINNGLFYYMNMNDDLSQQLKLLRSKAK
jgi:hypothetical protein